MEDRFVLYHWDGWENAELCRVDSEDLAKDIIRTCRPRAIFYSADVDWDPYIAAIPVKGTIGMTLLRR
ncbi:MAG: hypothetical protein V3S69_03870 [Dehalococcoidales bacterium]